MDEQIILFIDDTPSCWALLQTLAERYAPPAWAFRTAASIEEAIPILQQDAVALVLLDLTLEHMSGLLTLRRLYEAIQAAIPSRWQEIPVVILTGGGSALRPATMALGAVGFVSKLKMAEHPVDFFQFLQHCLTVPGYERDDAGGGDARASSDSD